MDVNVDSFTSPLNIQISNSGVIYGNINVTQTGTQTFQFTSGATGLYMILTQLNDENYAGGAESYFVDNVVVKEVLDTGNTGGNSEIIAADLAIFAPDVLSYNDLYIK